MSARLFLALEPPASVQETVADIQGRLRALLPDGPVRWQDPVKSHLTLLFLSEVADAAREPLTRLLGSCASRHGTIRLATAGLGVFPSPARPSVIWLGVDGDLEALGALRRDLVDGVSALLRLSPDPRFTPHLTLGRLRRHAAADGVLTTALATARGETRLPRAPWLVERIVLVESRLARSGSTYTTLASAALQTRP